MSLPALSHLFWTTISTFDYSSATGLLDLSVKIHFWAESTQILSTLARAIKAMDCISSLNLYYDDPDALLMLVSDEDIMFPSLKTLSLRNNYNAYDFESAVLPILARRQDMSPITLLNLKFRDHTDLPLQDIRSLDEMTGLTVVWARFNVRWQYSCGGSPNPMLCP